MNWIESGGGPLIVIEEALAGRWTGFGDDEGNLDAYGRAYDMEGWTGVVGITSPDDPQVVLVIGGEPLRTTYLPDIDAIVQWGYAPSEGMLLATVRESQEASPVESEVAFEVSGPLIIFDAALSGETLAEGEFLEVWQAPGKYTVTTSVISGLETEAIVHTFHIR